MRNIRCLLPHPYVSAVFIAMFVWLLIKGQPALLDTDVPWHLAAGDYMIEHGIPQADPFSFSAGDTRWINLSWAWDIGMSAIVKAGGLESLRILTATMLSLTLAVLMHHLIKRGRLSASEACLVIAVVALVFWPVAANARPQLASFLFTAWLHYWLFRATTQQRVRSLYAIPLLTIIWANMHGGFLAVYVFVGIYFIQSHLEKQTALRNHLFIVGVLCLLAALVTPWHIHIVEGVLRTLDSVITAYIEEWQPLNIGISIGFSLAVFLYILLADHQDKNLPLADRVIPVIWLVAAFESSRNFYYFALTAAPFIAWRFHQYNQRQSNSGSPMEATQLPCCASVAAGAGVVIVLLLGWFTPLQAMISLSPLIEEKPIYSAELFDAVATDYPDARFWNDYDLGGYMIYRSKLKPFVDGRAGTAYPESLLIDFIAFQQLPPDWEKILQKYQIDGLVLSNSSPYVLLYEMGGGREVLERIRKDDKVSVFLYKPAKANN